MRRFILFICLFLLAPGYVLADVVKPALVEISVFKDGRVQIELRASIEALLTGINADYKNTQDSPRAAEYDALRAMRPKQLRAAMVPFESELLQKVWLKADNKLVKLKIGEIHIPEPGYTKVPRISVINLSGTIDHTVKTLQWYYPAQFGDHAVRVREVDEAQHKWHWSEWQWLRKDQPSKPFSLTDIFTERPLSEVIFSYMRIGFQHIVPEGSDHILFILGIFLLSLRLRPLLSQVTMFTIAHTITLGLSVNGIVSLPANVVQPLIALSIAYVGVENIITPTLNRSRLFLVFGFGLLHGLSFASVLKDFGMPTNSFATALISFNVGVELGQIAVIAMAFFAVGLWFRNRPWYRKVVIVPCSFIISVIALYWMLDRLELFQ